MGFSYCLPTKRNPLFSVTNEDRPVAKHSLNEHIIIQQQQYNNRYSVPFRSAPCLDNRYSLRAVVLFALEHRKHKSIRVEKVLTIYLHCICGTFLTYSLTSLDAATLNDQLTRFDQLLQTKGLAWNLPFIPLKHPFSTFCLVFMEF